MHNNTHLYTQASSEFRRALIYAVKSIQISTGMVYLILQITTQRK